MKKIMCLFLLVILLCSCNNNKRQDINYIAPIELNDDEKDLFNLLGEANDIGFFEYKIDNTFKSISIYLEVYEKGQLITKPQKLVLQAGSNYGKIGVFINKEDNYNWRVSCQSGNGLASSRFKTDENLKIDDKMITSTSNLSERIEIKSDKEIVLKVYIFQGGNMLRAYDGQDFIEHPENLKQYEYVCLLKCNLSKNDIDEQSK